MKIDPNAPWYPVRGLPDTGVTIRLKLAAMMTLGQLPMDTRRMTNEERIWVVEDGFKLADTIIERAGKP